MRTFCCVLLLSLSAFAGEADMQTRVFPLKRELVGGHALVRPDEQPDPFMEFRENRTAFVPVNPDEVGGSAVPIRHSARSVLLEEGIPFPPGASAVFHPQSGLLSVRNTPENLRHTQLFLEALDRKLPANRCCLVTVIEAPGETIRQVNAAAVSDPDCGKTLASLLAAARQANTQVSVIGDAFVESLTHGRSLLSSIREHVIPSGMTTKARSSVGVNMNRMESGLRLETESWPDLEDIQLKLDVSTRPPSQRSLSLGDPAGGGSGAFPATSIWQSSLTASLRCQPGETRLLSVATPLGTKDKDVLWAMFVTTGSQHVSDSPPSAALMENSEPDARPAGPGLKRMAFHLPEGFLDFFVAEHAPDNLQRWLESNGLEKIPGATASETSGKLMVTNTQENIERVDGMLREMRRSLPGTPVFTLNTIRGPAFRLRDLTRAHILRGDHTALWKALQDEVAKGAATYLDSARIIVDSNGQATHHSGRKSARITGFATDENGRATVDFEERAGGSMIELEARLPPNDECIYVNLRHQLDTAPPSSAPHLFKHPASGEPFQMSLPVLHTTTTDARFAMTPGTTRMVSLCHPPGGAPSDELCATFISCDVTRQIPSQGPARTAAAPKGGGPAKQTQHQKRETRVFQPPAGFISSVAGGWGPISSEALKDVLKQTGINLPADAVAQLSGNSGILRVSAAPDNLDQIDAAFQKTKNHFNQSLVVTAHVFEGAGPFIREVVRNMRHEADDSALLTSLQNGTRIGKVKYATTMRVETKSGVKAQAEQARQVQQLKGIKPADNGGTDFVMEMRKSGYLFEAHPALHPDDNGIRLEFSLECSPADPVERLEHLTDSAGKKLEFQLSDHLCSRLASIVTLNPETTKLVWVCRVPDATDDRLYAMFLSYSIAPESQ